jgi:energy-coupling factor transport system substrate-specific component
VWRPKISSILAVASLTMILAMVYMAAFMGRALLEYIAFLSIILLVLILGIFYAKFEESGMSSKEVALVGILAAISAASRIPFAALPNIQPCTFLIIVTGLVFGALAGAMVGSMTALVSNFFFGQGPWTVWEMMAWAMVGIVAGYVGKRVANVGVKHILALSVVLGIAYTLLMDFSSWITFYRSAPELFIPTFVWGAPFGGLHVLGNLIFSAVLGKPVLEMFKRFKRRSHVSYQDVRQGDQPSEPEAPAVEG